MHGPGPFGVANADHLDEVLSGKCRITPRGAERRAVTVQGGDEQAARAGGTATAALNGANEAAVGLFLAGKISFTEIARRVEGAMAGLPAVQRPDLDAVLAADAAAREAVLSL